MKDYQNNAYFWQKVDALYLSGDFRLVYPKGTHHPVYPSAVFPCDYGHVQTFENDDEAFLRVFRGTKNKQIQSIVVCANVLEKQMTTVVLVGMSEDEEEEVLTFLNQNDFQKTVIIKRGSDVPGWAFSE